MCGQFFTAFLRVFHALFTGFSRTFYGVGPRTGFPRILACTHASVDKYQLIVVKTTVMRAQIASRPVAPFDLLFLIMSFDEQLAHGLKSTCQDADLVLLEFKAGLKPPCGNLGFQKQANWLKISMFPLEWSLCPLLLAHTGHGQTGPEGTGLCSSCRSKALDSHRCLLSVGVLGCKLENPQQIGFVLEAPTNFLRWSLQTFCPNLFGYTCVDLSFGPPDLITPMTSFQVHV